MALQSNMVKRLLIYEDDEESAGLIRHIFERKGYTVFLKPVVDNYEFDIAAHQPHVILLDLRIPSIGGEIVCRNIKEGYDMPVILYSADYHLPEISKKAKADDWIRKPFRIEDIFQSVDKQYHLVVDESKENIKSSGKHKR